MSANPTNIMDLANYVQQQGALGQQKGLTSRFNALAGQAYNDPAGADRNALVGQAVATDPTMGVQLGNVLAGRDAAAQAVQTDHVQKVANAAKLMLQVYNGGKGDPAAIQGTWNNMAPYLSQVGGRPAPSAFDPSMLPAMYQAIAASNQAPVKGVTLDSGAQLRDPTTGGLLADNPKIANGEFKSVATGKFDASGNPIMQDGRWNPQTNTFEAVQGPGQPAPGPQTAPTSGSMRPAAPAMSAGLPAGGGSTYAPSVPAVLSDAVLRSASGGSPTAPSSAGAQGPNAVPSQGSNFLARLPAETQSYVPSIIQRLGGRPAFDASGSPTPSLIQAMTAQESGGNPNAVSSKGAGGLLQLMPATASSVGVTNVFDPQQNIAGATKYLQQLHQQFGDNLPAILAGYNAGPTATQRAMAQTPAALQAAIAGSQGGSPQTPVNANQITQPVSAFGGQGGVAQPAQPTQLGFGQSVKAPKAGSEDTFDKNKAFADKMLKAGMIQPSDYNAVVMTGKAPSASAGTIPGDTSLTGQAYLNSIPDQGLKALLTQITQGQQQIPKVYRSAKAGEIGPLQIGQMAALADPTFDQTDPMSRIKAVNDFKSGVSAAQIQSLGTLAGHLVGVSQAIDALPGHDWTDLNSLENNLRTRTGNTALPNFNQAAQPASEEFAKLLKGTGAPTEQEIKLQQANLDGDKSHSQLRGVLGTMASQVESRMDALQARANASLGPYASKIQIISPETRAALEAMRKGGNIPSFHIGDMGTAPAAGTPTSAPGQPAQTPTMSSVASQSPIDALLAKYPGAH